MRTLLKLFITVVVLGGAFLAYLIFQPASAVRSQATSRPAAQLLQHSEGGLLIGEGENAWVRQFDEEGRFASRFRAAKWEPQKNGLVRVIRPEAEMLLKGGRDKDGKDKPRPRVTIRGDDGEVVVQGLPEAAAADKPLQSTQGSNNPGGAPAIGPPQPPSSGRLNGVVIQVFETEDATVPVVTLRTNNIVFDNETFRISTESYSNADGTIVEDDEVPVSVEGPHFDFYGRGLTVRWNDLEERLDLLRVAHGERLVIKNVGMLAADGDLPLGVPNVMPATSPAVSRARVLPAWSALASADPSAALVLAAADKDPAASPATKPSRRKPKSGDPDKEEPTYRAAFVENVRVVQGERQLALARLMNVDFLLGQRKPEPAATQPAGATPETRATPTQPASAPTSTDNSGPTSNVANSAAQSQPATAPVPEPVTVYWTGELNVTPVSTPATAPASLPATGPGEDPLAPGEARVELVGGPVLLTRDLLEVRTGRLVYRTGGHLFLDKTDAFPRVLITQHPADKRGVDTTVITEGLAYSTGDRIATLRGESRVLAPIERGTKGQGTADMLDAAWRDSATFHLVGEREEELWVEHAEFAGDVNVKAPQGTVRAHRLELAFDAPTAPATQPGEAPTADARPGDTRPKSQPNLRRVIATDSVYCELLDAKEGRRLLECQRLALETARSDDGMLYPRLVDAGGQVRASTDEQQLHAGQVLLRLRRSTAAARHVANAVVADASAAGLAGVISGETDEAPPVELESMTATDSVRVASKDGGVASGKRLLVTVDDIGHSHIELSGDPARVEDATSGVLTGPRILVDPNSGVAHVPGPGTLRTVQRDNPKNTGAAAEDAATAGLASPGRPIEVTWSDHADVRAADDRIEIAGSVSLWITDPDGSVQTATAGRVVVELAAKPAEPSANAPEPHAADAPTPAGAVATRGISETENAGLKAEIAQSPRIHRDDTRATSRAAGGDQLAQSVKMDLFKDKEVAKVHLHDDAAINSKLSAPDGSLLRQFHLKARTITYDVRSRHLTVPGAGRMLVESHEARAAEAEPAQAKAGEQGNGVAAALAAGNGVTAFQWAKSLAYEESSGRAVMDGSVIVSHQPDPRGDKREPAVRLDADALTAEFDVRRRADGDAARAGSADGTDAPRLQLRSIGANGTILISRDGVELAAHRIDYDAGSEWVIARGTGREPATFTDPSGTGTVRAGELWLNTRTWAVKVKDVNTRLGGVSR